MTPDQPAVWRDDTGWHAHATMMVNKLAAHPKLWHVEPSLKYVELRIDTRDGAFQLMDRNGQPISPHVVLRAMDKLRDREKAQARAGRLPPPPGEGDGGRGAEGQHD